MKNYEKILAEAVRVEFDEKEDRLFIVFEVRDPLFKKEVKSNWTDNIEYKLINKNLILKDP